MSSILILAVAGLCPLGDVPPEPIYRPAMETISELELRAWLRFLASPELEGRESGTRGYDLATRYVASVLEALGVAPGGEDGTYFQEFSLVRRRRLVDSAYIRLTSPSGETETHPLKGEVAVVSPGSIHWRDPWVFAGYGEGCDSDGPDDFSGLSLEGRVVMVLPRKGKKSWESLGARAYGVRRLVVISDHWVKKRVGLRLRDLPQYRIDRQEAASRNEMEIVYISRKMADRILKPWETSTGELLEGPDRPESFPLDGLGVELRLDLERSQLEMRNVLGLVKGSDPRLQREVVVVGAHLDHVGVNGEKVYYGADDNASGSAAILGAAKAFSQSPQPPRRSLLFALFGGEEKGLHGSRFFVDHPTTPLDHIVLMINLDMVGRNEEHRSRKSKSAESAEDNVNTLHMVGTKRLSRELQPWVLRVNRAIGFDFEYDEERVFGRSDHYHFAQQRIPVAFFFSGFHPDYHKPTDTIEKINFDKVLRVSRLAFGLAYEVADRQRRLIVNRF